MIYEIATISSFFILSVILMSSTLLYSFCKKNKKQLVKTDKSSAVQKKIRLLINLNIIFISLLLLSKLIIFLFAPDTILTFDPIVFGEVNFLMITFFYAIFWIMILLSLLMSEEIKAEYFVNYLQKLSMVIVVLFFLDFCLSGLVYIINITQYFNLAISIPKIDIISSVLSIEILLILILILMILMVVFFVIFILKRKISLLRFYELCVLILLISVGYLLITNTSHLVGWNESVYFQLKLFSIDYGFIGLLFFSLLAVTLITNSFVILLFNLKDIFKNSVLLRNRIVNHMKIGFIATIALCALVLMPHFILWIYEL